MPPPAGAPGQPPRVQQRGDVMKGRMNAATVVEMAQRRVNALYQQISHVGASRGMAPCGSFQRFQSVRPFADARDPWGRAIRFECVGNDLAVRSAGPDGRYENRDDVVAGAAKKPPPASDAQPWPMKRRGLIALFGLIAALTAWVVVQDQRS